ncbi:MAG: deoxyribodipyrimidine photo-lyase [Pseudomonadota bacterium]
MTSDNTPIVVWIRKDLRLTDNPALAWASSQKRPVIIVFIVDPDDKDWQLGGASKWWLHHSLTQFSHALEKAGSNVRLFTDKPEVALRRIIDESDAGTLVWNRRYEPANIALDKKLKKQFTDNGVNVTSFHGNLCQEPWQVQRNNAHPYRVFSAYWRASLKVESIALVKTVRNIKHFTGSISGEVTIEQLSLLPTLPWANEFAKHWQPGEAGAQKNLKTLIKSNLANYQTARDLPAVEGTSRLSPHLAFGEISPRTMNAAIRKALIAGKITDEICPTSIHSSHSTHSPKSQKSF